ncbi:MAG: GAF domain-containing protein, partial [Anaerolineales bacterium]
AHLEVESSLREPFERLAEISLELNALHTLEQIQTYLVEETTELIGGERMLLILDEDGKLNLAESYLPVGEDAEKSFTAAKRYLEKARLTRTVQLIVPKRKGRSRIVAPLIAQNQIIGYLYTDMDSLYGKFNDTDRDMLGMLANQGAVALDNAGLLEGLERKVEERTEELNARVNELAVINSVQEGLASKLDIQEIYDLVGDKVREIFHADTTYIVSYDHKKKFVYSHYYMDKGKSIPPKELPFGQGIYTRVIKSQKPLLLSTQQEAKDAGGTIIPSPRHDKELNESGLYVPILRGREVTGVVSVQSYKQNAFNDNDVRLLTTLANSMSVALQNAQSFKAEQERVAELQIINSIQQGLAAELDFQAIVDLVGDKLREVFRVLDFGIRWYDERNNLVHYLYEFEHGERLNIPPEPPRLGSSFEQFLRNPQPLMGNTVEIMERFGGTTLPGTDTSKSLISVPIISGERVIGSLQMEDFKRENAFGESELRLLTTIAASLGTALENALLFDETQQRNAELAVINAVQSALAAELDIHAINEVVGEKIRDIFDANTILLISFDHENGTMHRHYAYEKGKRLHVDPTPIAPAWAYFIEQNKPMLVNDGQEFLKQVDPDFVPPAGAMPQSFITVPLTTKGKLTGAVSIQNVDRANAFAESDVRLLETLANATSVALENARLFDEVQKKNIEITESLEQQTATSEILQVIAGSPTDVQPVFDAIIERAVMVCGGDRGIAFRLRDDKIYIAAQKSADPNHIQELQNIYPIPLDTLDSNVASVIRNGTMLHVNNMKSDSRIVNMNRQAAVKFGLGAVVFVPLIKENKGIGALAIERRETVPFTEKQLTLLKTFANQAVIAIENVRLFNELQQRNIEITEALERETASNDILRVIAESPTDIQPILDVIAKNAAQLSGSEDAIISLRDGDILRVDAHYGDIPMIPVGEGIHFDRYSVAGRAILEGHTLQAIHNQRGVKSEYPEGDKVAKKYGYRATCAVPLLREGKAIGVIVIRRIKPELLTEKQIAPVQSFANQAAIAVENVRLFEAEQQRVAELQIINSVQQGLAKQLEFQNIIDLVGEKVGEIFEADTTHISMYDVERDRVLNSYYVDRGERIPFPDGPAPRPGLGAIVVDTRKPLLVGTNEKANELGTHPMIRSGEVVDKNESYLGVPILTGNKPIGIIAIQSYKQNAYKQEDLRLLTTLANSMSVALENARLFDETQRLLKETEERNAELAIINSVQQGLVSKLDMQGIYELVGDRISEITGSEIVVINTWNYETETSRYEYVREKGERGPFVERPWTDLNRIILPDLESGKTIYWQDGMAERLKQFGHSLPHGEMPLSVLSVPLRTGERINTSISLQDTSRENAFSESTIRLIETLAGSTGIALENARLFDETQRLLKETEERNSELAIINTVQTALASKLDFLGVIYAVGDKIHDIFPNEWVLIGLVDREHNMFRVHYIYDIDQEKRHSGEFPLGEGLINIPLTTREPLLINNDYPRRSIELNVAIFDFLDEEIDETEEDKIPKSWLGVPIVVNDEAIGGINLQNMDHENAYSESDVRLLQTLANSMSVALENARLFDETQRLLNETEERNAELAVINSVQQALAAELDMQGIYDAVGDKIRDIFDAQGVVIGTLDKETKKGIFHYFYEKGERFYPDPISQTGLMKHLVKTGEKIVINENLNESAKKYGMKTPAGENSKSAVWIPIKSGNTVRGVVSLQNIDREHAFSDSDVRLLETLTNSMSVALENARLFDETQRLLKETEQRAAELALINSVQQGLASKLDIKAIIDLVGDKIRDVFDTQTTYIALHEKKSETFHIPYYLHRGQRMVVEGNHSAEKGPTGHIIQTRKTLLFNEDADRETQKLGATNVADDDKPQSWLGVPMIAGDDVVGVISLQNIEHEHAYSSSDVSLLITIASSLAVALQNAQLFEETNRLLSETEQRAGELSAISTVSQALVAETELDSMIQLIGNQMREIFEADIVYVALLDSQTG